MRKRGSSSVFLAVILACLMSVTLTLVCAGRNQAGISIADGMLDLASVSLLSEYDYYVQRDYGLFLLRETDSRLSASLRDYTGLHANASSGRFSTVDTEHVRRQIIDYMKIGGAVKTAGSAAAVDAPDRTLRHGPTITALPSRALPDSDIVTAAARIGGNLKNPETLLRTGTETYFMAEYILRIFNRAEHVCAQDHFFSNEVEYILCGKLSDAENRKRTNLALEAVRSGLNLTHIYSDPEKVSAVTAAAEAITPGPLGAVTQFAIATSWAAAEAANDVKLLHKGHKVPIIKTDLSWAIDLDSVLKGYSTEDSCIYPEADIGRTYEDYLRILLCAVEDNLKTARILDLIQINMRKNYDETFLAGECAAGVSINAEVNGKKLSYDRVY